ncbi:hypothetical protein ACERK3_04445 [Phycisphaerales bacterium AB-hyl4]|uniref:YXWGXW repeat-containing protein n=1 Tax=Natronomicrosphaera hydrolytica TaxID=3242702 RepID=A0ABV4U1Q7_9BACT
MSRRTLHWPVGVWLTGLCVLLLLPAAAVADERADRERTQLRATEALNPAAQRQASEVRVIRDERTNRRAYAYEVNGRERVSVAPPQRVDREPRRVQRTTRTADGRRVDEAERTATRDLSSRYQRAHHDSYEPVTVTQAAHRSSARARAEASVREASRRGHVQREAYAGYRHTPRSRVSGSVGYYSGPTYGYRSHRHYRYDRGPHWYDWPVSVGYHYHYSSRHRHRFGTSIGVHLGSPRYCSPPLRFHHRHHHRHRGGSRFSIDLRF